MTQQCRLLIDGVDQSKYLQQTEWQIIQNWGRQGDTARFWMIDSPEIEGIAGSPTLNFVVRPGASIQLIDDGLHVTLFNGIITDPQLYDWQGPNLQRWWLNCVDWTYLANRAIVVGDYSNVTTDFIIKDLTAQANCGITADVNISQGVFVPRMQINYLKLSDAWTQLAAYSSQFGNTYGWLVDENLSLHFYNQNQIPNSGVLISDQLADINADSTHTIVGNYDTGWRYEWDASDIRNSCLVRGGSFQTVQTDTWVGDGSTTSWPLSETLDPDGLSLALTVAGVAKTVDVDTSHTGANVTTDFVLDAVSGTQGDVWFLQIGHGAIPTAGQVIQLTYNFRLPVITRVDDLDSQADFANLPNRGIFQDIIQDTSLIDLYTAKNAGLAQLGPYKSPEERAWFTTTEVFQGHVRAGQIIEWKNRFVPDSQKGYAPGVDANYLVYQCYISGKEAKYRTYQMYAARINTPVGGTAIGTTGVYGTAVYGNNIYA